MSNSSSNGHLPPFLKILIPFGWGIWVQWYWGTAIMERMSGLWRFAMGIISQLVNGSAGMPVLIITGSLPLVCFLYVLTARMTGIRMQLLNRKASRAPKIAAIKKRAGPLFKWKKRNVGMLLFGIVHFFGCFCCGALLCGNADLRRNEPHFDSGVYLLLLQATEPPVAKSTFYRLECKLLSAGKEAFHTISSAHCVVYLRKEAGFEPPQYGERFILSGHPQLIAAPANPGSFDYKKYAARKGIFHQVWGEAAKLEVIDGFWGSTFQRNVYAIRDQILRRLREYIKDPDAVGIAEALLVGYRFGIDASLNEAYTRTGVVHIIAISGMHLSMLFGLLALIPISRKNKHLYGIKIVFILAVIWFFTILAGAAPSILRASVMFTIMLAAPFILRRHQPINTLLATAFILLVTDPMYLWDIGFQLSFTAVGGLLLFLKPLSALFQPQHPVLRALWQMQVVSIAAQILTTPLVLYHFNQFPVLFLVTNFVAIPLSGLILYLEIVFCLFVWSPLCAAFIAVPIEWLLQYMNNYIVTLSGFSFCVYHPIYLSQLQVILLYSGILGSSLYAMNRRFRGMLLFAGSVLLFFILRTSDLIKAGKQHKIIVYQVKSSTYTEIIMGRKAYYWHFETGRDPAPLNVKPIQNTHVSWRINQSLWSGGVHPAVLETSVHPAVYFESTHPAVLRESAHPSESKAARVPAFNSNHAYLLPFYDCGDCIIGWWNLEYFRLLQHNSLLEPGVVSLEQPFSIAIVAHGPPPDAHFTAAKLEDVSSTAHLPDLFVLSPALSFKEAQLWKQFANKQGSNIHDVRAQGSFIRDL